MPRALALVALALVALALNAGCGTGGGGSPGTPEAEAPEDPDQVQPSLCAEVESGGALTTFSGSVCGWTLLPVGEGSVELIHFMNTQTRSIGQMPSPCATLPCSVRGVETPAGPLLVVEQAGPESEVPVGVWLGVVLGEQLRFIDLWEEAGDLVVEDGISLGPAHALAPFDCEGVVAVFAEPRLPGAAAVPTPVSLQSREGAVAQDNPALTRARCERLSVELP